MADRITSPNGTNHIVAGDYTSYSVVSAGDAISIPELSSTASTYHSYIYQPSSTIMLTASKNPYARDLNEFNPGAGTNYIVDYRDQYSLTITPNEGASDNQPAGIYATASGAVTADLYDSNKAFMATHPNHITTKKYVDDKQHFGSSRAGVSMWADHPSSRVQASTSLYARDARNSGATGDLANGHTSGFNEINAENTGVTIENSPISNTDTGYAFVVGNPTYYDGMVRGLSAVDITPGDNVRNTMWDYSPFMATEDYHVATKKYVDDTIKVSTTQPTDERGFWFNPSTGELKVWTE